MNTDSAQNQVDEATFEFTMGNGDRAIELLQEVVQQNPEFFPAWHAMAEVYFDQRKLDDALNCAQKALAIHEEDVHLHTTLSRIHMESGRKDEAESHGARARILGWKNQLKETDDD